MNITNAIVLSRKKSTKFLGDNLAYQSNEEVIVEGFISSFSIDNSTHNAEESISVNGQDFGAGIVRSITSSSKNQGATDNRQRVVFEIFKSGTQSSLGAEYPSINTAIFKYIKSFSENLTCDINQDIHAYAHTVNVKLTKYDGNQFNDAKSLADTFLANTSVVSSNNINSTYSTLPAKTFFDETYDQVNGECNFSKKYEIGKNTDSTAGYILFRSNSLNYDNNGVAVVTENAEYQDLTGGGAPVSTAVSDMNGALTRCSSILDVLTAQSTNVGTMSLKSMPIIKALNIDNDVRKVTYKITYTTNIRMNETDKVYHDYSTVTETTNTGITYTSLEGSIVGMGDIDVTEGESAKYKNAQKVWTTIAGGQWPSSGSTGGGIGFQTGGGTTGGTHPYSFSTNHNTLKGTINYNIRLSDCSSIQDNAPVIRRKIHKISTQPTARQLSQTFRVINKDEILQKSVNFLPSNYLDTWIINGDSTVQMKDVVGAVGTASVGSSYNYGQSTTLSFNSSSRQLTATTHIVIMP
jgi:hypothetical protein